MSKEPSGKAMSTSAEPKPPLEMNPTQAAAILAEALAQRATLTEHLNLALDQNEEKTVWEILKSIQDVSQLIGMASTCFQQMDAKHPARQEMEQLLLIITKRVQQADEKTRQILSRAGFSDVAQWLDSASNSQQAVIETLLEAPWDKKRDLIVLLGDQAASLVPALMERGQKRIFCQAKPSDSFSKAIPITRIEELDSGAWKLGLPLPQRFRISQVGANGLPTPEVVARLQDALPTLNDFGRALNEMAPKFMRYCSRNLATIANLPSAHSLSGIFPGVPAIIVSAGPSLDKNIHLLKEFKGRAVIICINQTVKALRQAGVQPDIALACDYQNLLYHFEGSQPGELPTLGLGASVMPDLFFLPADRIFTFAASPIVESWIYGLLGENASLRAGGTVSVTALHLAIKMSCSPIVFIGQDFALAGRKYYAHNAADGGNELAISADGVSLNSSTLATKARLASDSTSEKTYQETKNENLLLVDVPAYNGGTVQTTLNMRRQILALRAQINDLQGKAEFINATEGGAFLEGMRHLRLAEVLNLYGNQNIDICARIHHALSQPDLPNRRTIMKNHLGPICEGLRRAVKFAHRCRKTVRPNRGADKHLVDQLKKVASGLPFLPVLLSSEICEAELRAGDENITLAQLNEAEASLYRTIEKDGKEIIPMLEAALKELSEKLY